MQNRSRTLLRRVQVLSEFWERFIKEEVEIIY